MEGQGNAKAQLLQTHRTGCPKGLAGHSEVLVRTYLQLLSKLQRGEGILVSE